MTIKQLYLDVDGVLVDWCTPTLKLAGAPEDTLIDHWDVADIIGVPEAQLHRLVDDAGPEYWRYLPQWDWTPRLLQIACKYSFHIATSPGTFKHAPQGKKEWIADTFGPKFKRFFIGNNKGLLGAPDSVLIDDSDENCEEFERRGGHAIVFPQPWNSRRGIAREERRIDYVIDRLHEIEKDIGIKDRNWFTYMGEEVLV